MAKTVPCFINAYKYSYFGANWWLFGWSADALIALLPGFTYIYTYSLKPVAQMYSVAPWVFRCISWKWYEVSKCKRIIWLLQF